MVSALVLGSTGLTGSQILAYLKTLSHKDIASIVTLGRRKPEARSSSVTRISNSTASSSEALPKVTHLVEPDTSTWPAQIYSLAEPPEIIFSALGTTRSAAGSLAAQFTLEHDLNLSIARAAKERGTSVYVLVSSFGATSASFVPYLRMKAQIEKSLAKLQFDKLIVLRPTWILGDRNLDGKGARGVENAVKRMFTAAGDFGLTGFRDFWTQDAAVIAVAAVKLGLKAVEQEGRGNEEGKTGTAKRAPRDKWGKAVVVESRRIVQVARS